MANPARYLALNAEMIERGWLTNDGPLVQEFERRLAQRLKVKHALAMVNGTIAMQIALRALDLSGEMIIPSFTFVSTAHALTWLGLTPRFADIDAKTHSLDVQSVRAAITPRTSAIIATHLWGCPCDVAALQLLASEFGLKLLLDAAHAFDATLGGVPMGSFGACEVFSFHATKCLNSIEGGAVTTNDDGLAGRMRLMRNFGFSGYDNVVESGTNGKMNEACAAMGIANLEGIDDIIAVNRRNHGVYREGLAGIPGTKLFALDTRERNNFHYVVLEIGPEARRTRDELVAALHGENVLARKYFWPGCHRLAPYRVQFPDEDTYLPVTNAVSERVVVLPTGTAVSAADAGVICDIIREQLA